MSGEQVAVGSSSVFVSGSEKGEVCIWDSRKGSASEAARTANVFYPFFEMIFSNVSFKITHESGNGAVTGLYLHNNDLIISDLGRELRVFDIRFQQSPLFLENNKGAENQTVLSVADDVLFASATHPDTTVFLLKF